MKILIVDDEAPARARIRDLLSATPDNEVVGEADNGQNAVDQAKRLKPECVLLDISMPVMDGIEAAMHLDALDPAPLVIFCTAYDQHAMAAFDARAVAYLLKPVRRERLLEALERVQRLLARPATVGVQKNRAPAARTHLCARLRGNLTLVALDEISHFTAEDKYVIAHMPSGEILIEDALKSLEDEFAGQFLRIHRNCLVAIVKISGLKRIAGNRFAVLLAPSGCALEVSRRSLPGLRKLLKNL